MGEAGDVRQVEQGDMQAPQPRKMAKEIQVLRCPAIDVQLDLRAVAQQLAGADEMRCVERLAELQDATLRLQRPQRAVEAGDSGREAEEAAGRHGGLGA